MITAFNRTIDYIEGVLPEAIDERIILRLSGYSYPMFSRIFSILAGYPLGEYVRLRKLTRAALELRETNDRVIDIAIRWGYESPDAFTQAFRRFHGHTPTEVRNGAVFKVFSSIRLALTIQGGNSMDIKIEPKGPFQVAGIRAEGIDSSQCPETWERLYQRRSHEELTQLGTGQSFGICYEASEPGLIHYMAAYDLTDELRAREMKLDVMAIPAAEYACVRLKGPVPESIHRGWKYILEVFFPEQGYRHAGTPDLEVYGAGDLTSPDYEMELWIPVIRA